MMNISENVRPDYSSLLATDAGQALAFKADVQEVDKSQAKVMLVGKAGDVSWAGVETQAYAGAPELVAPTTASTGRIAAAQPLAALDSQFDVSSIDDVMILARQLMQKLRDADAKFSGDMSIMGESAAYATGQSIRDQGLTAGISTALQGTMQFSVAAMGTVMSMRATAKEVGVLNKHSRTSDVLTDRVEVQTNLHARAATENSVVPKSESRSSEAAGNGFQLENKPLDNHKDSSLRDVDANGTKNMHEHYFSGSLKNHSAAQTHVKAKALTDSAYTMGQVVRAGGQVQETGQKMEEEISRSSNRVLTDTASQGAERNRNDNSLVRAFEQMRADMNRQRVDAGRSIAGNIKA